MGAQKQYIQSKGMMQFSSETEFHKPWPVHNESIANEVKSEQDLDNQIIPASSHDQGNGVDARCHHMLPSAGTKAATSNNSSIGHRSVCVFINPQKMMMIPACNHFPEQTKKALMFAVQHPPVTTTTVRELNLHPILNNIRLRSDINFETDLHFMPKLDKHAEKKREQAQEYWKALAAELQVYLHAHLGCPSLHDNKNSCVHGGFTPRLRQMFTDLRELLETLVPDADHVSIAANLDVPFLMQQIENGVLDISSLAEWLAVLLKSHCAPVRDEWVDQMRDQIAQGARASDMLLLVKGIEAFFSVLEAMKLDGANHQIRTLRFYMMEDTISFQQKFFAGKILEGKVDPISCRNWFEETRRQHLNWLQSTNNTTNSLEPHSSLIHGILTTTLSADAGTSDLPASFEYDAKRIDRLRADIQDHVHLKTALMVFDELHCWLAPGQAMTVPSDYYAELQLRILAIVDEQLEDGDAWQVGIADVALEIARAACECSGNGQGTIVPDCLIQSTVFRLKALISGPTPACAFIWEASREKLFHLTMDYARLFADMTPLEMSEAQQQYQQQQQQKQHEQKTAFRPLPDMHELARRLAHVGILHWKIWANLVYLNDAEVAWNPN